jgi:hypothetical protein
LNTITADLTWQHEAKPVLESYLRKIGITSPDSRARWIAHVLGGLQDHVEKYAADEIVEQAVERLRTCIDTRLAQIADLDPQHERRKLAGMLVVLQDDKHYDLLHTLFTDFDGPVDPALRERLRNAVTADLPQPVRADARLDMPIQTIELRPLNPLRRLLGSSR